jgi:hypothetical protein
MADFAILTGISWYPNPGFGQLQGPPNDLELIKDWLIKRGGLLPENIKVVATPTPPPPDVDPDLAPPIAQDFDLIFRKMLRDRYQLGPARVKDRLYLYFSGHGFANRSQDRVNEAALYCANATREMYEHIFGTHYARVALGWALFKEIVLIMDCCRDSEIARVPIARPYRDAPDDKLAADVHFLSIYAVPKGGKAQERPIAERDGRVHGLLTHALVKLLEELPSDTGSISATELRQRLWEGWESICGDNAAPRPEVSLPSSGEVFFPIAGKGNPFEFRWKAPPAPDSTLTLIDNKFQTVATFSLSGAQADNVPQPGPVLNYVRHAEALKLRMRPGYYGYRLSSPARQDGFKVDGGDAHVDL